MCDDTCLPSCVLQIDLWNVKLALEKELTKKSATNEGLERQKPGGEAVALRITGLSEAFWNHQSAAAFSEGREKAGSEVSES